MMASTNWASMVALETERNVPPHLLAVALAQGLEGVGDEGRVKIVHGTSRS